MPVTDGLHPHIFETSGRLARTRPAPFAPSPVTH